MAALAEVDVAAFEGACAVAKKLTPSTSDQLRLYGLFKQATQGDVTAGKPYAWDVTGRAKWTAWKSRAGLEAGEARAAYVDVVRELGGGGDDAAAGGDARGDGDDDDDGGGDDGRII